MRRPRLIIAIVVVCTLAAGVALAWRFTPLAEFLKPREVSRYFEAIDGHAWAPLAFVGAYILGSLILFPVTVMSAVTATMFVPLKAVSISFTGIMLSSALSHWLGAHFFRNGRLKSLGRTQQWLEEALTDRGIVTVAAVRMMPIAPFTLVNVAAGALGVRLRDFMLGTALGLLPGIAAVCLFGRQVRELWKNPSAEAALWLVGAGVLWIGMSLGLQHWVSRRSARRGD